MSSGFLSLVPEDDEGAAILEGMSHQSICILWLHSPHRLHIQLLVEPLILICQVGPRRVLDGECDRILRDDNVSYV